MSKKITSSKICSDGRKTAEKKRKEIKSNLTVERSSEDPKDTFKYPRRPELSKTRYFWQMPFRDSFI